MCPRPHAVLLTLPALLFAVIFTAASRSQSQPSSSTPTGAGRCVFCHQFEVEGYSRSSMAHALGRAAQEPPGKVPLPHSTISVTSNSSGTFQSLDSAGVTDTYKIEYVIGSGNHASGYLINLNGHLFQSPIAWYKSRNAYDLAPGYENLANPDFTRPVGEACVFCHSGTSLYVPRTLNEFRQPAFAAEAITCERCHGPVERHLADPRAGTIINPAKLPVAARDSICEQCHLFGVARVPNPGKQFSDFLAGQPLERTFSIYHNAAPAGSAPGTFKVISHVEQLALSKCARGSNQQLWCGTCHDPHNKPAEPVAFYRDKCLACHATVFNGNAPAAPLSASHPARNSDCIRCHMPRRDAKDGGHTAFTDHRIQRRPEPESDLPTDAPVVAWREPSTNLRKRNLGIALIDAGIGRRSQSMVIEGFRNLTEVQNQFAGDSEFFSWIGQALLIGRQSVEAEIAFDRAVQLNPTSPVNLGNAASAYAQAGDLDAARTRLERAVALDPLYLPAAGSLVVLYRKQGKLAEADALSAKIDATMHPRSASSVENSGATNLAPAAKPAEQVFKNIQVLKGTPSDRISPAMEFMASSLGVNCAFCHIENHFDNDDKKTKKTARAMMRMTLALNKSSFDSRREVTCYSCHRGAQHPEDVPAIASPCSGELVSPNGCGDTARPPSSIAPPTSPPGSSPSSDPTPPTNLPTVSEILDRYIAALGGAQALEQITTRIEKGVARFAGNSTPIEIFTATPVKQSIVRHLSNGDSVTIISGDRAWFAMPGRPARAIQGADLDAARLDADLHFPLHIRETFPELRCEYPEQVETEEGVQHHLEVRQDAYVLVAIRENLPRVKLYFDQSTGLLLRQVRYADSPFGEYPTQLDYRDYRPVDGIQVSFRRTISQPSVRSIIQLSQVHQNVSIDPAHFIAPNKK
jgi:photosynthetic reaction center cytochrome c subunit